MRKSLIVASLLLASASTIVAAETNNSWFVGGEFGAQNMKFDTTATEAGVTENDKNSINSTYEALKIGKYFEFGRVYGSLGKQNEKDDFSSYTIGLSYDYLLKNTSAWTPFLGINASYTKGKIDDEDINIKPKGFNYGAETGLIYAVSKNTELEVGIRYLFSNVDDSFSYDGMDGKIEGDHVIQYYLGLNYKF